MPVIEQPHDFGAVTANTAAAFSLQQFGNYRGSANVPQTARIAYAVIRNNTSGNVTVRTSLGTTLIDTGLRKLVQMPGGARWFTVIPSSTTTAGQLTADIGIEGMIF